MKLNQDLYLKLFLMLVILSLVGYLIYAIIAGVAKCNADNFANKMKNGLNNISFPYNTSREGFADGDGGNGDGDGGGGVAARTLELYYASWCPHCKKFVDIDDNPTDLYNDMKVAAESKGYTVTRKDCADGCDDKPSVVEGFPTWVINGSTILQNATVAGVNAEL